MDNKTLFPLIAYGCPHTHCNSLQDCANNAEDIVDRLFTYGAQVAFFSDHGTMMDFELERLAVDKYRDAISFCATKNCTKCPFGKACGCNPDACTKRQYAEYYVSNNLTMKCVTGVEAYFEDESLFVKRAHLLLLPKDAEGFTAIYKAVTSSNANMDSQKFPRMNLQMLNKFFGPNSNGYGHVIASSACMVGVLASVLLANTYIDNDIAKLQKKLSGLYSPQSEQYLKNRNELGNIAIKITNLSTQLKALNTIAKRPFTKKEKAVKAAEGKEGYEAMLQKLNEEKEETAQAKLKIEEMKAERNALKIRERELKEVCKTEEKDHEKWSVLNQELQRLESSKCTDDELYTKAKEQALLFDQIFGHGNFFAEVQYHRIPQEAVAMPLIAKLAREMNLPLVATNDAHMVRNTPDELKKRQIVRSMRFNQWEPMSDSDKELYIKTDAELIDILSEIIPHDIVMEAMDGIRKMAEMCDVHFEYQSHYPAFPSEENATDRLRRLAHEGISWRYPNPENWTPKHARRLEYELDVITKLGYCDYLCIVQDFLEYGRLLGKMDMNNPDPRYLADPYNIELLREITKDGIGMGIGPGRGSGVGSLVCYLIGITGVDPIKYDLIFERFLNAERVSMPDIDSDFHSQVREKTLDYIKYKYGQNAVCCIMSRGSQMAKAAIRNCARLLGSEKHNDISVYRDLGDAIAKAIPKDIGIKLKDCEADLREKFKDNKTAQIIIDNAKLVEGTFASVGMHAAGVIIADNGDVREYVPLMFIPGKGQWATQCDKDMCEGRGLLKMDLLGLRNLCVITDTMRLIYKRHGVRIDMDNLPFDSNVFSNIFSEGSTNSVFQFESSGMKQMLRQFQPTSIEDIILLVAAYRPGPMQYLESIIAVKQGKKVPEYVIPEMETVLGTTYGSPIYQEQIMQIFNKFAGFSLGESDIIRRYMSKKKTEKFAAYKDKFVDGLIARGATQEKATDFWEQLVEFSRYAFNKSHAAAYAYVAYYTAWLKYKYPREYLTAVINYSKFEKLGNLLGDCRSLGIPVAPPDINVSESQFSVQNDAVTCGLSNIKGIGQAADSLLEERETNGKFTSFANFMLRTKAGEGTVKSLIEAGAFDSFCHSREALVMALSSYASLIKKIKDKEKLLKDEATNEARKQRAQKALDALLENLKDIIVDDNHLDDVKTRLQKEKDLVGAYVSAHPVDSYEKPERIGCTPIGKLVSKRFEHVMGIVCDLRVTRRKSDGAEMAFFRLEDKTGSIDACVFTNAYKKCGNLIKEDAVLKLTGDCKEETVSYNSVSEDGNEDEQEDVVLKFYVSNAETLAPKQGSIQLHVKNIADWTDRVENLIIPYQVKSGMSLYIVIDNMGLIRKTTYLVTPELLHNKHGLEAFIYNA